MNELNDEPTQEYDDDLIALLEAVWGEGFMSPGGPEEIDRILQSLDLAGKSVLDIGCGLGGGDVHIAATHHASVTGIDIEPHLVERAERLALARGVSGQARFQCVEPGPLPFEAAQFQVVTSKDSIIHIEDKHALSADIFRVLAPGGCFAASDWLAGYEGEPSPEMLAYVKAEGLDFGLANVDTYRDALQTAGFVDVEVVDRNEWYRHRAREERENLAGPLYAELVNVCGVEFVDHEIDVWDKMIVVLDRGELRPTHLRAQKPS